MKLVVLLFISALLFNADGAQAVGREGGNGGHPIGIEFKLKALEAIAQVHRQPDRFANLAHLDLANALGRATILVVDQPLEETVNGITQKSPVRTTWTKAHDKDVIEVYEAGWNKIYDDSLKQRIALHEVLVLAEIDSTGQYNAVTAYDEKPSATYLPKRGEVWRFHKATAAEQSHFMPLLPTIPEVVKPKRVQEVSQTIYMSIRDHKEKLLKEVSVTVLHYDLEYLTVDDHDDFYQLVLEDVNGKVYSSDIVLDTDEFQLNNDLDSNWEDIQITSLGVDKEGRPGIRYRAVNDRTKDYQITLTSFEKRDGIVDWAQVGPSSFDWIILGRPSSITPYGLYRISSYETKLVRALPDKQPGDPAKDDPKYDLGAQHLPSRLLGVFRNGNGTYALVNVLNGVSAININTGEAGDVYTTPEEGKFVKVERVKAPAPGSACAVMRLAIYNTEQGPAVPGYGPESQPRYRFDLGVSLWPDRFFTTTPSGCRPASSDE